MKVEPITRAFFMQSFQLPHHQLLAGAVFSVGGIESKFRRKVRSLAAPTILKRDWIVVHFQECKVQRLPFRQLARLSCKVL